MNVLMGPVLKFNGILDGKWQVSALLVVDGDGTPKVSWSGLNGESGTAEPALLKKHGGRVVWRCDWAVSQAAKNAVVTYKLGTKSWQFAVPGSNTPLRMAFASCNGFHSRKDMKKVDKANDRWSDMATKHKKKNYHLLLLGGDQVYADPMWEKIEPLVQWLEGGKSHRRKASFTKQMATEVEDFYFELYCDRWKQPEPQAMLASIPSLMMWDDHDIFDGWGSYPKWLQDTRVYKEIFRRAEENFRVFQLQQNPKKKPSLATSGTGGLRCPDGGFSYGYRVGSVGLLALDTRSQRTEDTIISEKNWTHIFKWMDQHDGLKHLLVMASVPVVYPSYATVETALRWLPGQQDLEDDLLDHWRSRPHRAERLRLIHRLLKFATKKSCRVTILSGDVHIAALGVIESGRSGSSTSNVQTINQLISSPIVNLPQPRMSRVYLDMLASTDEEVDRNITARMLRFPGTHERFINLRNWLSLCCDRSHRIWADWHMEGEKTPYTKVIHPPSDPNTGEANGLRPTDG